MADDQQPTRRPYTGSCHCGATKFITHITLPHTVPPIDNIFLKAQRMYRCNCTTCLKLGIFHFRPHDPTSDFLLLSPLSPDDELGVYMCNQRMLKLYFCKMCGGRCISFAGESEVVDVDLGALGLDEEALNRLGMDARNPGGLKVKAWRPKKGVFGEGVFGEGGALSYLSVNAYALDAGQGIELKAWTDAKWVGYMDLLDFKGNSYDGPRPGGAY